MSCGIHARRKIDNWREGYIHVSMLYTTDFIWKRRKITSALKEWRRFKIMSRAIIPSCLSRSVYGNRFPPFVVSESVQACKSCNVHFWVQLNSGAYVQRSHEHFVRQAFVDASFHNQRLVDCLRNEGLWSDKETQEIISRAVEIYLKSNRRRKVSQPAKIVACIAITCSCWHWYCISFNLAWFSSEILSVLNTFINVSQCYALIYWTNHYQ